MSDADSENVTLTVAAIQLRHRASTKDACAGASQLVLDAAGAGAKLILLPEYWFAARDGKKDRKISDYADDSDTTRGLLRDTSADAGAAVAGNVIERKEGGETLNTLYVFDDGHEVGRQAKVHPMPREAEHGIDGVDTLDPFEARGVTVGGLVCADIFYPEAARVLSLKGAEILLNPVMSPYYTPDRTKAAREAVYIARAWDSGAFVVKAGGFAKEEPFPVVGRSLITAPWGTLARHANEFEEAIVTADLDLTALRAFRDRHRGFQARVPNAYAALTGD